MAEKRIFICLVHWQRLLFFFSVLEKLFCDPVLKITASVENRLQNHSETGENFQQ